MLGPKIHENKVLDTIPQNTSMNIYGITTSGLFAIHSTNSTYNITRAIYLMIFSTIFTFVYDILLIFHVSILTIHMVFSTIPISYFGGFNSIIRTDKIQFIINVRWIHNNVIY